MPRSTGQTVVLIDSAFQVSRRCCPKLFAKHSYKCTWTVISSLESRCRHFFSGGKQLQSMQQTKLLSPPAEIHSCFLKEYALNRSLTCAAVLAQFFQRSLVRGIGKQTFYDSH